MITKDILNSHPVSILKKEISKTNIKGYSKMKKAEVINLMLKNSKRFNHIKMKGAKEAKQSKITDTFKKQPKLGPFKLKPEFQK